ncbi:MAG: hypothetical protein M3N53_06530 [Actinomycetota bacterium]|nr:hypothetical protein [Actinomycetota bacterium]
MRRRVAYLFYIAGSFIAINAIAEGGGFGLIGALAVWWIAVGFGVRLGVSPDEFASSVKRLLGFGVEYDISKDPSPEPRAES